MDVKPRTVRARRLRADSQRAEHKLWVPLRGRALGGFKFRRQQPIDRFVADFACVEARVVVELDGSHHSDKLEADEARTEVLRSCGWLVLRFDNAALDDDFGFDHVLADILATCRMGRAPPLPRERKGPAPQAWEGEGIGCRRSRCNAGLHGRQPIPSPSLSLWERCRG